MGIAWPVGSWRKCREHRLRIVSVRFELVFFGKIWPQQSRVLAALLFAQLTRAFFFFFLGREGLVFCLDPVAEPLNFLSPYHSLPVWSGGKGRLRAGGCR